MPKTPVYFFSHGHPLLVEQRQHAASVKLEELGREITTKVKPKAVIIFSAHWQAGSKSIAVNTAQAQPLIYDFYGFPAHLYDYEYPHQGSPELAHRVVDMLTDAGIEAEGVERGPDHGVWVPLSIAFDAEANSLGVPIVQVSLFDNEDPHLHYKLGQVLAPLRDEGILIIGSGMAVHNLRDLRRAFGMKGAMPYTYTFDEALREAAEAPAQDREDAMAALLTRSDARAAHPTFEHLLPIHIAAGAAANDAGKQLFTLPEASTSWAMYRFGDIEVTS